MNALVQPFRLIWQHRLLLRQTVKQEFARKYAGSTLGLLWMIGQPLLLLGVYAMVYVFIFKVRFHLFSANEYVLMIFCGLVPFLGFSESLNVGTGAVVANSGLIKNTLFPIELVPVRTVLAAHGMQAVALLILLAATLVIHGLSWYALALPLLVVFQLMFLAGLIWILSALNVFLRDLQHLMGTIVMLLMMISPIAYTTDMVPHSLRMVIAVNPVAHFIFCYQDLIFMDRVPPLTSLLVVGLASPLLFVLGYQFFIRMKQVMVDHV